MARLRGWTPHKWHAEGDPTMSSKDTVANHTLEELKKKGELAMEDVCLQQIAVETQSPNAAFTTALKAGFSVEQSRSCRFLAMIKRDYGDEELDMHMTMTNAVNSWYFPVMFSMNLALSVKVQRELFEHTRSSVMRERSKLPAVQQPMDASAWEDESRKIGYPSRLLSECFKGLVGHYGQDAIITFFDKARHESTQTPGFGLVEPEEHTEKEVYKLLQEDDPVALESIIRFIIKSFSKEDVETAWNKAIKKRGD